jgi:hydroxymethylbilane synthase
MWQARHVAALLSQDAAAPRIIPMVSSGDVDMRPIDGKRSVGVFTKRIQQALLDDEGDVAVHSLKDLPTEPHPQLTLAACPGRETTADCLVSLNAVTLDALPQRARVGTGSRRRQAQLLRLRPDLQVLPIRGNVQTRLSKLESGEYDAIVLAAAGITRLEMHDLPRVELPSEVMLPAPGQGALGVEVRADDAVAQATVSRINVPEAAACTMAERALLAALHGGCLAPIAALATVTAPPQGEQPDAGGEPSPEGGDGRNPSRVLKLHARVLSLDGTHCLESRRQAAIELQSDRSWRQVATDLGRSAAEELAQQGARELIEAAR